MQFLSSLFPSSFRVFFKHVSNNQCSSSALRSTGSVRFPFNHCSVPPLSISHPSISEVLMYVLPVPSTGSVPSTSSVPSIDVVSTRAGPSTSEASTSAGPSRVPLTNDDLLLLTELHRGMQLGLPLEMIENSLRNVIRGLPEKKENVRNVQRGLPGIPEKKENLMEVYYRFLPDHTDFINSTFTVTNQVKKRLKQICRAIGFKSTTIPFYVPEVFEYSNLGRGMRGLVHETYEKVLVEVLSFYKGGYGRVIILVSLGVCCTIWSIYVPGVGDCAPALDHFPRFESYQPFFNPETQYKMFQKACFIERTDLSDDVIKTIENEFPFSEMSLPATGNTRIAVGLGLMIAVFMALGLAPSTVLKEIR